MKIMSYVFQRVPSSIKLPPEKGTVIWPLVRMFGGSMISECFGGFLDQIKTGKIKGTVVWPLVALFGGSVPCARIVLTGSKLRPEKRYIHLAIGWNVYYLLLTYYTLVDRPSAMTPWGIYPGRKILAFTSGK